MMSKLHFEMGGSGPAVVLLHSVGFDLTFLAPIADLNWLFRPSDAREQLGKELVP